MSDELSRFESLAGRLNSYQYHVFRSMVILIIVVKRGYFSYMVPVAQEKFIYVIPSYLSFALDKHIILAVASLVIASFLLPGGKTAHSIFKIPLQHDETSICFFDKRSERAELI